MKKFTFKLLILILPIFSVSCKQAEASEEENTIVLDSSNNIELTMPDSLNEKAITSSMKNYLEENDRYMLDTISYASINKLNLDKKARMLYKKLIEVLPKLSLTTGKGENKITRNYYIIEGDIRVDKDELLLYCYKRLRQSDKSLEIRKSTKLTVATDLNGIASVWNPGTVLKYTVNRSSFATKDSYDTAVKSMALATKDWSKICNIKFLYVPQLDNQEIDLEEYPENYLFIVRQINSNEGFIAQAFFPHYPKYNRFVFLDPSFFTSDYDKVGVLRHELGHVLGWRHEHIWSEDSSCSGENVIEEFMGARQLTNYDPYSVMHYPCGLNANNKTLKLTPFDIEGASRVYPFKVE